MSNKKSAHKRLKILDVSINTNGALVSQMAREGDHKCIVKCNAKNCKTCFHVNSNNSITHNSSNFRFRIFNETGIIWNCRTKLVVYLLECRKCGLQYVGQTTQALSTRFGQHRREVENNSNKHFIYQHFHNDHSSADMTIRILESVTEDNKTDLTQRETFWIEQLNTIYPYGLNDRINGWGTVSDTDIETSKTVPYFKNPLNISVRRKNRTRRKRRTSKKINDGIFKDINTLFNTRNMTNSSQLHRKLYILLRSCTKRTLEFIQANICQQNLAFNTKLLIIGFLRSTEKVSVNKCRKTSQIILNLR